MNNNNYLVTKEWLYEHLGDPNVVIADCRYNLNDPEAGRKAYEDGHIPGAVFFDLKTDLSREAAEHGGRHPLPAVDDFVMKMNEAGIDEKKHVVVYDDQNGSMAGRLWWLLMYVGQENASLLDESYSEWVKQGYPVTAEVPKREKASFEPQVQAEMLVDIEDVKKEKDHEDVVLLDARAPERFYGENEPMDAKAGHIPGAENWFWKGNVSKSGKWKTTEELTERYKSMKGKDKVIVYCGSGVSANANYIALKQAGIENVKLYAGSWSDWSSYDDNPVEKGR